MNSVNKDFCGTDAFPFSISTKGCFVCIENGAQGLIKIRQEFLKVPTCRDGNIISLCDGSDESKFVEIYDATTITGNYAETRICLLPSDFGFETKAELLEALAMAAGIDIRLFCCAGEDPFAVTDADVFCGGDDGNSYPKCKYDDGGRFSTIVRTTLVTSVGRIPLPVIYSEIVPFLNAWIEENGLSGMAIDTGPSGNAVVRFEGINFSVYEIVTNTITPFVASECQPDAPDLLERRDERQGVTPVMPDRLGLMGKSK